MSDPMLLMFNTNLDVRLIYNLEEKWLVIVDHVQGLFVLFLQVFVALFV
jgi:hypothetical protein